MASLKDSRRERFCQVWHETGNKSEAYRKSHPNSLKWKDETVHKRASELSLKGEVAGRYKELQELALKSHGITIESLIADLKRIMAIAESAETPQCSAAISAVMNQAKLVGLDAHKSETKIKIESFEGDFDDI